MKILGQIISVQPLALIVSLPNQLLAHVPITHISAELTSRLDAMDEDDQHSNDDEDREGSISDSQVPGLADMFCEGQYLRAVVSAIHPPGSSDVLGIGRVRDEVQKASRRVELSLQPERVNEGVIKSDLVKGFVGLHFCTSEFLCSRTSFVKIDPISLREEHRRPRVYSQPRDSRCEWIPIFQRRKKAFTRERPGAANRTPYRYLYIQGIREWNDCHCNSRS